MQANRVDGWRCWMALAGLALGWVPVGSWAQDDATPVVNRERVVARGVAYLVEKGQDPNDGSFSSQLGPAVTALSTTALLRSGMTRESEPVAKAMAYLQKFIQSDGGIYAPGSKLRNYETSIAIMCLTEANTDGRYDREIEQAVGFLKGLQWDAAEGHPQASAFYGGQGYGSHERPDLSNTSFFIDALKAAGEDVDSEALQKALVFVARTQNLSSPSNTQEFAQKVAAEDRGGFIYSPVGPETKAGESDTGGLRSYASMTYAGLKSFLYAGVDREDVRVQAAMDWISRNYRLDSNPGMGQQGLYYYYHVFAKALNAYGTDQVADSKGVEHDWRADVVAALGERQREDGSWINPADRWYEGDPNLVTAYALLALSYCEPAESEGDSAGENE